MVRMMSPGLLRYLAGRVVRALLTVVGLVTIVFLLVRLIPGDPVEAILGDQAGPEEKAELRRALDLDRNIAQVIADRCVRITSPMLGFDANEQTVRHHDCEEDRTVQDVRGSRGSLDDLVAVEAAIAELDHVVLASQHDDRRAFVPASTGWQALYPVAGIESHQGAPLDSQGGDDQSSDLADLGGFVRADLQNLTVHEFILQVE